MPLDQLSIMVGRTQPLLKFPSIPCSESGLLALFILAELAVA